MGAMPREKICSAIAKAATFGLVATMAWSASLPKVKVSGDKRSLTLEDGRTYRNAFAYKRCLQL